MKLTASQSAPICIGSTYVVRSASMCAALVVLQVEPSSLIPMTHGVTQVFMVRGWVGGLEGGRLAGWLAGWRDIHQWVFSDFRLLKAINFCKAVRGCVPESACVCLSLNHAMHVTRCSWRHGAESSGAVSHANLLAYTSPHGAAHHANGFFLSVHYEPAAHASSLQLHLLAMRECACAYDKQLISTNGRWGIRYSCRPRCSPQRPCNMGEPRCLLSVAQLQA